MKSRPILSLLGLCLSVVCAWGNPTYYVNVAPGYTLFATQLALSPNDLTNTPLGQMLTKNSQIITVWEGLAFTVNSKYGTPPIWLEDPTISVGQGFFCRIPLTGGPLSIPFTGTASTTPTPIPDFTPTTRWYLLGSQTYDATPGATYSYYDITGYTPVTGLSLYRARNTVPGGIPSPRFPFDAPLQWNAYDYYAGTWHPFEPEIVLGEAVWIGPSSSAIEGTVKDDRGNPLPNWEISLSDGQYTFTDANGEYDFAVSAGVPYTITQVPSGCWASLTPPLNVTISNPGDVSTGNDFSDSLNASVYDLSVQVSYVHDPGTHLFPCPQETGYYSVHYYNAYCAPVVAGSTLTVTLSSCVTYGSSVNLSWSQTPPTGGSASTEGAVSSGGVFQIGSTLYWTLGPLPHSGIGEIRIPVTVATTVISTIPLITTAQINPPSGVTDFNTTNNVFVHSILPRCSNDPNDKTVVPAGCGSTGLINGNQLLTYTVQFQNLGSAPAFDVVVTDQLDPSLDPSTLKILGASHNYVFQLNGNQMTWTFPHIYLPDATNNEPGSHGFFSYQVQPLPGLSDGTVITNQASVVFDLNPPVLTAITTNTITSATLPAASFTVTPRPGSAGHTNDFTYTGGTAGATFLWDFGTNAIPPTSTNMNPSGVVFPADGLRTVSLQVFSGDCTATPASYLLSVGRPRLNIASIAGNQVVLSWQGGAYSLQKAGTLSAPILWQSFSPTLTQVGATHFASLNVTNVMIFYRLTDQP